MSDNNEDMFVIYYGENKVPLKLIWRKEPPLLRSPALRCVSVPSQSNGKMDKELLLVLTVENFFYSAILDNNNSLLYLDLQRNDVVDLDYLFGTEELYIVTSSGAVFKQKCNASTFQNYRWEEVIFDPLEISEETIQVRRVCCSKQAVIFITQSGDIYVFGRCGDVFSAELQPTKIKLFGDDLKIFIDIASGDDFFVFLMEASNAKLKNLHIDFGLSPKKQNDSVVNNIENEITETMQKILNNGHTLLHTQVYTLGAENNGLLGTGDHIKRSTINNIEKLDCIGVCSITTGREHTVARTLDGRLFHWGINTKQQLNTKHDTSAISSPTEIKFDKSDLVSHERTIIDACCGDYKTMLLNAAGTLCHLNDTHTSLFYDCTSVNDNLEKYKNVPPNLRLLLVSGNFTLYNSRSLKQKFLIFLKNLHLRLRIQLNYSPFVDILRLLSKTSSAPVLDEVQYLSKEFKKITLILAAATKTVESYYRADFDNARNLLFVKYHREYIKIFESYTKSYCDIYSIDGFTDASKAIVGQENLPLLMEYNNESDLMRIFQQPFQIFPIFMQILENLSCSGQEFKENLIAWNSFGRQNCIDQELAVNTQEFWKNNEKFVKIQHFRQKHRRVILASTSVPIKLNNSLSMSSTMFILFSDSLCQVGSLLFFYPLNTIWLEMENDTTMRIITPEKNFTLTTRCHLDKMIWYDQLNSSIANILGTHATGNVPNVRTTNYVFSPAHAIFPNVNAYGCWRSGVLHGQCYLEYPDGRVYFGDIDNGGIEGFGKLFIPSVGLYEGRFKCGKFHGFGVFKMKNNDIYEGNFRNGLFHGHGIYRNSEYTYIGEYDSNKKHGYGVFDNLVTGNKYMGMFSENKFCGPGSCITVNGDYYEGIFATDELIGTGIVVFENNNYYEGELNIKGPCGKGTYYIPNMIDLKNEYELTGNILNGILSGNWKDMRIQSGTMTINCQFSKYPKNIGEFSVQNNLKWSSLFKNFEDYVLNVFTKEDKIGTPTTEHIWRCIAISITNQRNKTSDQFVDQKSTLNSYFTKNILEYGNEFNNIEKKYIAQNVNDSVRKINDTDPGHTGISSLHMETSAQNYFLNNTHSSCENDFNKSNERIWKKICETSFPPQTAELEYVPSFGKNTLSEIDISLIKDYLNQSFKSVDHPLFLLHQQVVNCFYYSYGYWKMKPTPFIGKQALCEWESISKRIYKFIRKLFPALPENSEVVGGETVSHSTLLYPIILSESIYSILLVLYANKYSHKDGIYQQNIIYAEKLQDFELLKIVELKSSSLAVIKSKIFLDAIATLKQLQKKLSPKSMLSVIESCVRQINEAYSMVEKDSSATLNADNIIPLTIFCMIRASLPHMGAELALLEDLIGEANFEAEMNGLVGYCYTTLKASYEHIANKPLLVVP